MQAQAEIEKRLTVVERSIVKMQEVVGQMKDELVKININLKTLTDVQIEQVRHREHVDAIEREMREGLKRAHQRIDRIEASISRFVWIVLTLNLAAAGAAIVAVIQLTGLK